MTHEDSRAKTGTLPKQIVVRNGLENRSEDGTLVVALPRQGRGGKNCTGERNDEAAHNGAPHARAKATEVTAIQKTGNV